jgi:hypothetical protein
MDVSSVYVGKIKKERERGIKKERERRGVKIERRRHDMNVYGFSLYPKVSII